jgi:hypothetical protein
MELLDEVHFLKNLVKWCKHEDFFLLKNNRIVRFAGPNLFFSYLVKITNEIVK